MSASAIHPSASIAPSAKLAPGVKVGAFAVVGDGVELGDDCVLHAHAVVSGPSRFGGANVFYPFCVIGGDPQDYTFAGEQTELIAGDKNIFREYVTVSRGTKKGGGVTRIGDGNFFLAEFELAVAGKTVEWAGVSASHSQEKKAATNLIDKKLDTAWGILEQAGQTNEAVFGANGIGLERRGFSPERVKTLQRAFRTLSRSKLNTSQALEALRKNFADSDDVQALVKFVEASERGIVK